jgi:hypothetical protein
MLGTAAYGATVGLRRRAVDPDALLVAGLQEPERHGPVSWQSGSRSMYDSLRNGLNYRPFPLVPRGVRFYLSGQRLLVAMWAR